jgi:hypothetical protein
MAVMGEIDDLSDPRHIGEYPKGFLCPEIIEGLQNVVGDERDRPMGLSELVISRNAQGQIELKPRALG